MKKNSLVAMLFYALACQAMPAPDAQACITHTFVSSKLDSPDSTLVSSSEWNDCHTFVYADVAVANDNSTGTTLNKLAKITGAPAAAVTAGTSDTSGLIGVVVSGAGTSGNARVATIGIAACVFDGATTAGNYVKASASAGGSCTDAGSTYPTSGQVVGRVLSTNGGAGTYNVYLFSPGISGSEANTASNVGTAGVGVFKQKTGVNLEFKKLNAGSARVMITDDTGNSEVDIDVPSNAFEVAGAVAAHEGAANPHPTYLTQAEGDALYEALGHTHPYTEVDNVPTARLLGRTTAGTGATEALTAAAVKTFLDLTGTNSGDQTITLTGDVTGSGTGSFAATIAADAVTNAKLANMAQDTTKCRKTAGTGDPEDCTVAEMQALLITDGIVTTAKIADVNVTTGKIANDAVTNTKLANMANATIKCRSTAGTGDPEDCTTTQVLDLIGNTRGSVLYRGASGWSALTPGTSGHVLTSAGAGADPAYQDHGGLAGLSDDDHPQYQLRSEQGTSGKYGFMEYGSGAPSANSVPGHGSLYFREGGSCATNRLYVSLGAAGTSYTELFTLADFWSEFNDGTNTATPGCGGTAFSILGGSGISSTVATSPSSRVTLALNINSLTEETVIDGANDMIAIYDNSATANRKVKPHNLKLSGSNIDTGTVAVARLPAAATTKSITFRIGSDGGSVLADTDDEATVWRNNIAAMTITEVWCESDGGTPSINLQRDDGSAANILSSNLSCSTSGATGSIDTNEDNLAVGDKIDFVMVSAGGVAKRVTVSIKATLD